MANILQIKRRAALAGYAPFDTNRVNHANYGGVGNDEYKTGDKVIYQGNYYIALHNNDALVPATSPTYWQLQGPAAAAPSSLLAGELAFDEAGNQLHIGKDGSVGSIGGSGKLITVDTEQTVSAGTAFSDSVALSSAVVATAPTSASDTTVANSEFVQNVFSVLDGGNFDGVASGVGKYWYTTTRTSNADKWYNQSSWYTDSSHQQPAASLPDASTDVIILGNIGPVADIDRNDWVQPNSVSTGSCDVTFSSTQYNTVSMNISGTAIFTGNASYNK